MDELSQTNQPVPLPITGELDLHTFRPQDVADLLEEYVEACLSREIYALRIVHGKGIGNLRRTVHAKLARNPRVLSFAIAHPLYGGEGATIVQLKRATGS